MYPCRREVLEHSFRLSVPLQRKIIDTSIDNERTAAGKWAGRFGYVRHDAISRKTKNRQIKIRQLESETNPPNLIPAKFSGYTAVHSLEVSKVKGLRNIARAQKWNGLRNPGITRRP